MRKAAAGFTLVEVLVAVLVLALGMIGGVAMQLHAMRTRYESAQLSRAVQMAAAMADRIRANAAQVSAYTGFDFDSATEPHPVAHSACADEACSSAELADAELDGLRRDVAHQFGNGRARICRDAQIWQGKRLRWDCSGGAGAPLVIKIGWRAKNPDGTPHQYGAGEFSPGVAISVAAMPGAAP
ncbi:type IV pilus modification protein PilV [Pseudoduganella sp. RAF53_2]|uniref:type IV pilus modification protein PilV n=1 Tax=unclassified Pseudoduganella TaxID=2637179 RepID=UPI003F9B34F5